MRLSELYKKVVSFGIDRDPRKRSAVSSFEDTAILYGAPDVEVRKIMVGIDIDIGELLLADKIRREQGLDLVIAHHPEGKAWARFYEVMQLQVDILEKSGIRRKVAQELLEERKFEVERRVLPQNHTRSVDAARLLDMPFMCVHTPADNHVYQFISSLLKKEKPKTAGDILNILNTLPEYQDAAENNAGPRIISGNPRRPAGKILVEMTGGTEGPKDVFDKLRKNGIRTLVSMHLSDEHLKKVRDNSLNVVIAGHISSDNLGINLILDRLEKSEKLETFACSGFRRFRRN